MIDDLAQNITAAERLGMRGVVHTDAASRGDQVHHSTSSGHELEEAR